MTEPTDKELREHWDGCAGAEAVINDWRQRAESAEAKVQELETKLAAWEAARDRELIRRTELQDTLTEVKERLQAILRAL